MDCRLMSLRLMHAGRRYIKPCDAASELEGNVCQRSGSDIFGFSNPQIKQFIQELPNARSCLKYFENGGDTLRGCRAVHVNWKYLDYCNVCDMDEEYEDNLFLQCEKCRMMVHARCYGKLEPLDGVLWLCNLCRPGAPRLSPRCCLCPVTGGAMKPTTDGHWAHLACAIWIPETCLKDVKRMEPIDGLSKINKDRWKLLCSICTVAYGVCIQCSHPTCRVAYHPLCARAPDLCVELEDDDNANIHLMLLAEDEDPCIRILLYCKKHGQPCSGSSGRCGLIIWLFKDRKTQWKDTCQQTTSISSEGSSNKVQFAPLKHSTIHIESGLLSFQKSKRLFHSPSA
ncbi:hypothetical protein ACQ4PT_035781 [Festuca glaucescens]